MDLNNGSIIIGEERFFPGYTFEDFMKSSLYNGQRETKAVELKGTYDIDGCRFLVSFLFEHGFLNKIVLGCVDESFPVKDEFDRKAIHDDFLEKHGITSQKKCGQVRVVSDFFPEENAAVIIIEYFEKNSEEKFSVCYSKEISNLIFFCVAIICAVPLAFTIFDGVQSFFCYVCFAFFAISFVFIGIWFRVFKISVNRNTICVRRGVISKYSFEASEITKVLCRVTNSSVGGALEVLSVQTANHKFRVESLMLGSEEMSEYISKKVPPQLFVVKEKN